MALMASFLVFLAVAVPAAAAPLSVHSSDVASAHGVDGVHGMDTHGAIDDEEQPEDGDVVVEMSSAQKALFLSEMAHLLANLTECDGGATAPLSPHTIDDPTLTRLIGAGDQLYSLQVVMANNLTVGVAMVVSDASHEIEDVEPRSVLPRCVQERMAREDAADFTRTAPSTAEESAEFNKEQPHAGRVATSAAPTAAEQPSTTILSHTHTPSGILGRIHKFRMRSHSARARRGDSFTPITYLVAPRLEAAASAALPAGYNPFEGSTCLSQVWLSRAEALLLATSLRRHMKSVHKSSS